MFLFTDGKFKAFNDDGTPLVGGLLYTWVSGTTTPKTTWQDAGLTTPNTAPIVLNSRGEASVFLGAGAYTIQLQRPDATIVWTQNGVIDSAASLDASLRSDLAATSGSSMLGFLQSGSGAVSRTVQDKLREFSVSAMEFGAAADGDATAGTGTDNHTAITNAITNALARRLTGGIAVVSLPPGIFATGTRIQIPSGVKLVGAGALSTQIIPLAGFNDALGVLNTVESGFGQPPGGIFDLAVSGNFFVLGTTPGIVLSANASSCERVWVGGFAYTHLKCASTNQIISRVVIDNAITTANSVGIEIVSPGVQVDTCCVYSQETGFSVHDIPTTSGKVPIQISNSYVCNPIGAGYGLIVSATNGMPVMVSDFVAMSDLTTGYAGAGVKLINAPNVHIAQAHVEFPAACTQNQIGFVVSGTSADVTLEECSTKNCYIGIALQASYTFVNGGEHLAAVTQGVGVGVGIYNVVDGVTSRVCATGFLQADGSDKNTFQNNQALQCPTGFSIASAAGTRTFLKSNHADSSGTDYSVTGSTSTVVFRGNTNAIGPVAGPATVVTIAANAYTVGGAEEALIANFAGACTLTIPSASSSTGRTIHVKTITNNTVVSASSNVVPLAGGAAGTAILAATAGKFAQLQSDGTSWQVISAN